MGISLEGYRDEKSSGTQSGERLLDMHRDANILQIHLALQALQIAHPELEINIKNPEVNDQSVRSRAMREWVGDSMGDMSLSEKFRSYIENLQHENERIDVAKSGELEALLASVQAFPHVSDSNELRH